MKSIDHLIDTNRSLASPLNDQLDWVVAKALDGEVLPIVEHKVTRTGDDGLVLWILSLGVNLHCWSWIHYGNPFKFCKITNLRVQRIQTYSQPKRSSKQYSKFYSFTSIYVLPLTISHLDLQSISVTVLNQWDFVCRKLVCTSQDIVYLCIFSLLFI